MIAAILSIVLGGMAILSVVIGWRWLDARRWRRSLVAMTVRFPRGLKPDEVSAWLGMLGSLRLVVALELVSTANSVQHYLLVPRNRRTDLVSGTRALLPRLRLDEAPEYLAAPARHWLSATELRITHLSHQLATNRVESTSAALLGALAQLQSGETVRTQWLLTGAPTPRPRRADDPARELVRAEKVKHGQPLLQAVGRIAVEAATPGRAGALLSRIAGTLRLLDAPGVAVVRRSLPRMLVVRRMVERSWPLVAWPVVVNTQEAAGLLGMPLGETAGVPGLILGRSRQLPAGPVPSRGGTTLAASNYPGQLGQPLVLQPGDRLRHVYVVGPTGTGKSTMLAQMAIQDAARHGLMLVDPKGDLVETVLARLPEAAAERVVVLDPSQTDLPVGFNPLAVNQADEHVRELAADRVLATFKDLYRSYWGPRTDDYLRAALLSLVSVPAPNGQAFTVCEIPELLSRPALRRYVTNQPGLPELLKHYWTGFDAMSPAEQLQHIGPVMNKLRAVTMRTATRLMLGQSKGLDLAEVMRRRQVLLVSLAKGRVGTETAQLMGSLLVSAFWQAALGRVNVAPERRWPFYVLLDEFQDVVRMSESLPDLLSQARGLGIGAVLANQYLAQLPERVRAAVLGTVRSQVAFQVEYDDARLLERRFAPALTADDLMGLEHYEVAIRPSVDGTTATPVTGVTLPLAEPIRDGADLARASRERSGRPRTEVEADLQARVERDAVSARRPGRVYRRQRV